MRRFFVVPNPSLLLHPTLPKPLHGVNPRTIYGKTWWDKEREKTYSVAEYRCMACGVRKQDAKFRQWLEAHECYNFYWEEGVATMSQVVALCNFCHNAIHRNRLQSMVDDGVYSSKYQSAVLNHRSLILSSAGLPSEPDLPPEETWAPWREWRLILDDGVPHYSPFMDERHWKAFYAEKNAKMLR